MIKLTILYGQPDDPEAFERYYTRTHMPIAGRVSGVRRFEASKAVVMPHAPPAAFYRMAELYFDDAQHMESVLASPEAQAAIADIGNFATGGVSTLVSEVQSVIEG